MADEVYTESEGEFGSRLFLEGGMMLDGVRRDILVEDGRIAAVGPHLQHLMEGSRAVDARSWLLVPGLVNAHLHSHDRFDKGRFDKAPLEVWMWAYNPPTQVRRWSPRAVYLRTLLSGFESIRSGATTVIDDIHFGPFMDEHVVRAALSAYRDLGIRAVVSAAYSDKPYYEMVPFLEDILPEKLKRASAVPNFEPEEVLELWEKLGTEATPLVQFALSPSAPQRCTTDFLERTWALSESQDLRVIIHVLETRAQVVTGSRQYDESVVAYLARHNLLTPRTLLVHCIWVSDDDIALVANYDANVIHCPASNLKLGSGVAPLRKLSRAGITIGLGTDNHCANDGANMLETLKLTATLHRSDEMQFGEWPGAEEAFRLATVGGATAAGCGEKLGQLTVGSEADIVAYNLDSSSFYPPSNFLNQLVYAGGGCAIDTVIVAGKVIMSGNRLLTVDEDAVRAELSHRLPEIRETIEGSREAGQVLWPYLEAAYERSWKEWSKISGGGEVGA